jgi:hypothetical protein
MGPRVVNGEAEGEEEEDQVCQISVVTSLVEASVIRQMARISISPWGRPQGPLPPRTITDTIPSRSSAANASINRSRLVWLRYAAGSIESVWRPGAPAVHPLRCPNRQRPRARVMGLDGRAKPFSGGDGRKGAALRKESKQVRFSARGGH